MPRVKLDDLKVEALRELARKFNEPDGGTADELKQRLAAKFASLDLDMGELPIVILPTTTSRSQTILPWVNLVGILSALTASIVAVLTLNKTTNDALALEEQRRKLEWQRVVVYNIIQAQPQKTGKLPLAFSEIKSKYLEEAKQKEKYFRITPEDIQPDNLKLVLMSLQAENLIYETLPIEGEPRYLPLQRIHTHEIERAYQQIPVKYEILTTLSKEGGKFVSNEVVEQVANKLKLPPEEVRNALVDLIIINAVRIDKQDKLWSADKPPPP